MYAFILAAAIFIGKLILVLFALSSVVIGAAFVSMLVSVFIPEPERKKPETPALKTCGRKLNVQ